MTARSTAILVSLALVGFGSAAQGATLRPEFSGTDLSLQAGQTSTFTLDLDLDKARFVGGKVTIFSGDGEEQTFRIRKGDPTQTFSASFLYEEGGDYAASYVVKARYKERGQIVDPNDWKTICEVILDLGRERLKGQLGLQVADGRGELPDTGGPQPPLPPVIPPLVPSEPLPPEPPFQPPTIAVPGPIAGAGLPALLALGGFVWVRRRKAAA